MSMWTWGNRLLRMIHRACLHSVVITNALRQIHANNRNETKKKKLTLLVASETSLIICSKRAVSSACFWLCKAIFSLNFRGFAIMAALVWLETVQRLLEMLLRCNNHSQRIALETFYFYHHFPHILLLKITKNQITHNLHFKKGF